MSIGRRGGFSGGQAAAAAGPAGETIVAGAGLIRTGDTLDVMAHADGSIVASADDIKVGVLASDAQHGLRGGGVLHALAVAGVSAGFLSAADKTKLDSLTLDHGTLTGLSDDDHSQYLLLSGRSGGQTILGGSSGTTLMVDTDGATPFQISRYAGDASSTILRLRKARGTIASPAGVLAADSLGMVSTRGTIDSGAWAASANGQLEFYAAENFTATNQGTNFKIQLTPIGAAVAATVLDMTGAGNLTVPGQSKAASFAAGGTPAVAGSFRAENNVAALAIRNQSNTGDINVSVNAAGTFGIGNTGSMPAAYQFQTTGTLGHYSGSAYYWVSSASNFQCAIPRIGLSSAFASEGTVAVAMADADQVASAAAYTRNTIRTTGAITANRNLTLPTPASEDASYEKTIYNECTGAFSVIIKTAVGSSLTVTLPVGMVARVSVRPGTPGVRIVTAAALF